MDLLDAAVQPYPWGSRHVIAELRGRSVPSPGPEAELWMGAHPSAPCAVVRDGVSVTLDAVIAADPVTELGARTAARFGGRLPFLLKVLAADKALSIQVHPDRLRAERGYRDEVSRGVTDDQRNYRDDWPKPEVLVALTEFEVLAGFRGRGEAVALLTALQVRRLAAVVADLMHSGDDDGTALTRALSSLITWPESERADLLQDVLGACARLAGEGGPHAVTAAATVRIGADHPGDIGVVAALLLDHQVLAPGEAIYMPAGGLHAYVRGAGVEVLANSDNVLRAGLTGKHVDVAELLDLVDPDVAVPVLRPEADRHGITHFAAPVPEFQLFRVEAAEPVIVPGTGPRVVLAVEGVIELRSAAGALTLGRGDSAFVPDSDGEVRACGRGVWFVACPGQENPGAE